MCILIIRMYTEDVRNNVVEIKNKKKANLFCKTYVMCHIHCFINMMLFKCIVHFSINDI